MILTNKIIQNLFLNLDAWTIISFSNKNMIRFGYNGEFCVIFPVGHTVLKYKRIVLLRVELYILKTVISTVFLDLKQEYSNFYNQVF